MFTGIIESIGIIDKVDKKGQDLVLYVNSNKLDLSHVRLGDSIAVNGVCLTVIALSDHGFKADVSSESLKHTNIASYHEGSRVNLEKALTLSTRLGGHLVSGHVDGIGQVINKQVDGRSVRFDLACDAEIQKYIANKGSITVDGVSLTVTGLIESGFSLNIVPHTAAQTTIQSYLSGDKVHIEVDLMARYAEQLLKVGSREGAGTDSKLDLTFLSEHGYLR